MGKLSIKQSKLTEKELSRNDGQYLCDRDGTVADDERRGASSDTANENYSTTTGNGRKRVVYNNRNNLITGRQAMISSNLSNEVQAPYKSDCPLPVIPSLELFWLQRTMPEFPTRNRRLSTERRKQIEENKLYSSTDVERSRNPRQKKKKGTIRTAGDSFLGL